MSYTGAWVLTMTGAMIFVGLVAMMAEEDTRKQLIDFFKKLFKQN